MMPTAEVNVKPVETAENNATGSRSYIVNDPDIKDLLKYSLFKNIHRQYGSPPSWQRPEGFVSLAKIILGQQVSLASAEAHFQKLSSYIEDFTPEAILSLSDIEMRKCQVSWQKAIYLRDLSVSVLDESLPLNRLSRLDQDEVRARLIQVKGIGNWTADIYLLFCLQSKDVFPTGDIALDKSVEELIPGSKGNIQKTAERWKPLRSLAAYFLWHYYLKKRNRDFI